MRCLADLVFKIGILAYNDCARLNDVFRRWKSGQMDPLAGQMDPLAGVGGNHVTVCVLWDTVGSVIGPLCQVVDSKVRGAEFNFHALALHERRGHFLPTVMRFSAPLTLTTSEQCWFNGYHGDIGGGRKKNALGNIALAWALAKLHPNLRPNWAALEMTDNSSKDNWKVDGEECWDTSIVMKLKRMAELTTIQ